MTNLAKIHEIHMGVSYQNDHPIHKYCEKELNCAGYGYNRKHIISFNKQNQFDQSLSIIKGYLYNDSKKFIKVIERYVNITDIKNYNISNEVENNEIKQYMKQYQQYRGQKIQIIEWIINLYEKVKKRDTTNMNISHLLYFLGTIEWFHLAIIKYMFSTYAKKKIFIMGEYQDFDLLEDGLNNNDLFELIDSEYSSHSIVFMFTKYHAIVYDPDHVDNDSSQYNKLCKILNKKLMQIIPNQYVPVQEITDDQYCIFHCFWFIYRIVQMNIDDNNITKFMEYIKFINKMTKKSDVHFFINDLNTKANLFGDFFGDDKKLNNIM